MSFSVLPSILLYHCLLSPYISVHALSSLSCLSGHFISYFVFSNRYFTIIFFSHICNLLAAKKFSVFSSPLFWNRVIWRHFLSLLDLACRILLSRALSLTKCIFPPCQSGPSAISPMVFTLPPPPPIYSALPFLSYLCDMFLVQRVLLPFTIVLLCPISYCRKTALSYAAWFVLHCPILSLFCVSILSGMSVLSDPCSGLLLSFLPVLTLLRFWYKARPDALQKKRNFCC